jgi:protocatechuate 3,4-dioxygenase beta subunit
VPRSSVGRRAFAATAAAAVALLGCDARIGDEARRPPVGAPGPRHEPPKRVRRVHEADPGAETTSVAVRVEDTAGRPVPDAEVDLTPVGEDGAVRRRTDADGRVPFAAPPETPVRLHATAPGFDPTAAALRTGRASTTTDVALRLPPPGRLVVDVKDPDGRPVPGARVDVADARRPWRTVSRGSFVVRSDAPAEADAAGRCVASGLVRGRRYFAVAEGPPEWAASLPAEGLVVAAGASETRCVLTLRRFCDVVVRVVDEAGRPTAVHHVALTRGIGDERWRWLESGVYRFEGLAAGDRFRVTAADWSREAVRDLVTPDAPSFEVVLAPTPRGGPNAAGVVVDDLGAPVADASFWGWTRTKTDGGFELHFGPGDRSGIKVSAPGHLPTVVPADALPATDLRIVLRRAAVVLFRIPDDYDLRGVVEATFPGDPRHLVVERESDGEYRLETAPRGDTEIRLYAYGTAPITRRIRLDAGTLRLGDLTLVPPCELRGRVLDPDGRPVDDADVAWDVGDEDRHEAQPTDAAGEFRGAFAPSAGAVPLRVRSPRFLTWRGDVPVGAPATITLARGGLVWGQTVDAAGDAAPDVALHRFDAAGRETATATSDDFGLFHLRVPPGRVVVRADGCEDVVVTLVEAGDERVRLVRR